MDRGVWEVRGFYREQLPEEPNSQIHSRGRSFSRETDLRFLRKEWGDPSREGKTGCIVRIFADLIGGFT